MITVEYKSYPPMVSLTVSGHANHGEAGQDIVCAAVSADVYTLLNAAMQAQAKGKIGTLRKTLDPAGGFCRLEARCNGESAADLFEAVFGGLQWIAGQYPQSVMCTKNGKNICF